MRTFTTLLTLLFAAKASAFLSDISSAQQSTTSIDTSSLHCDEFVAASALSATGWATSTGGTSSGITVNSMSSTNGINTTQEAQGVINLTTGTDTTGRATLSTNAMLYIGDDWSIDVAWRVQLQALSDGTDRYTAYVGLTDATGIGSSEAADSVYFRYKDNVNSGQWQAVTRTSSTDQNAINTGVAAATGYNIFRVVVTSSSATYYINGTQVAQATSGIPSSSAILAPFSKIFKSAGTTDRDMDVDWYCLRLSKGTSRKGF